MILTHHSIRKAYADLKLLSDRIRAYNSIKKQFYRKMGYELDLEKPQSYNQKIIWKKLHDRNPYLTITADKFKVRDYIRNLLGEREAEKILIPLYCVVEEPEEIPFDLLPDRFVVKPNNGSRMHIVVRDNKDELKDEIIATAKEWLNISYGLFHYEWAYRNIEPRIIVEKLLESPDGRLPNDYKFYCFDGKCRMVRVSANRFNENVVSGYYDTDWNEIPIYCPGYESTDKPFEKPLNLGKMIEVAEKLSSGLDAVRIDLYEIDGAIYFGEFTHYEASGLSRLEPVSFDFDLGQYWNLKPEYWKNGNELLKEN
jgi:hypothetical protein